MKRFRFELDQILRLREQEKRMVEIRLGEINGACIAIEHEIRDMAVRRSRVLVSPTGSDSADPVYRRSVETHASLLEQRVEALQKVLAEKELERDAIRAEYNEVSKKHHVLVQLRERRADEHRKETLKEETHVLDEIGSTLYITRNDSRSKGD